MQNRPSRHHLLHWGLTGILALVGLGLHELGLLGMAELALLDGWMRWQSSTQPDPRFLVIAITEADLQAVGQASIPDAVLAEALETLMALDPLVIGIDLIRDLPIPDLKNPLLSTHVSGHLSDNLAETLSANPQTVAICTLGDDQNPAGIPPPLGIPIDQVGFADVVVDRDGLIRRNLLLVSPPPGSRCPAQGSLAYQLASRYLAEQGLDPPQIRDGQLQWGAARLTRLDSRPHYPIDAGGYQLVLRYGSGAEQVTLGQVLAGEISRPQVQDRILLIGATATSLRDLFATPITGRAGSSDLLPGVQLHAQMTRQLIDLALGHVPPIRQWSAGAERIWILLWAGVGSALAWRASSLRQLGLAWGGSLLIMAMISLSALALAWWIPVWGALMALFLPGLLRLRGSEQRLLGRYRVIRRLGQGGFGEVVLATDQERNQLCVIKKLILEGVNTQVLDTYKELFRREGEILRQLQHDRIPRLYGIHHLEQEDSFYLIQEYVAGIPLDQHMKQTAPWSEDLIRDFLGQMLQILAFIHQRRILHRDIKPSNIMRREQDGQWVLIDFGIGKQALSPDQHTTTAIGSRGYIPPEQEQGKAVPASDLYALGVVTIEAATGKRFASLQQQATAQVNGPTPSLEGPPISPRDPELKDMATEDTAVIAQDQPAAQAPPAVTLPLATAPLPPPLTPVVPVSESSHESSRPEGAFWRPFAPQLSDRLVDLLDSLVDPVVDHRPASATAALSRLYSALPTPTNST